MENLIFLTTDAGFRPDALDMSAVSVWCSGWEGNRTTECRESVRKALLHAWLFEHVCFIPGTWLVAARLPRWGLEDLFLDFP